MFETIKRREERTSVDWIALIRLADGSELPCTVKDVSQAGMRLAVTEGQDLPETFIVKVLGRNLVFLVRRAWRRAHHVGVQIERIARLPKAESAAPPAPQYADASAHNRIGSRERYRTGH